MLTTCERVPNACMKVLPDLNLSELVARMLGSYFSSELDGCPCLIWILVFELPVDSGIS